MSFFRLRDLARRPRSTSTLEQEEAAVDGATLVTCEEAVRRLQEMGLSALDAPAGVVRYLHLRLVKELVEIATHLAGVQMRLPPEQWPL